MPRAAKITQPTAPTLPNPSLPKGWRMVRFGDVVNNVNETVGNPLKEGLERFVGLEHLRTTRFTAIPFTWGQGCRWYYVQPSVALSRTGDSSVRGEPTSGKPLLLISLASVRGTSTFLRPMRSISVPELLPFLVQCEGFAKHAEDTSEGSLSPRTKWKYLAAYEFVLPSDLTEQRRIADLLTTTSESDETWSRAYLSLGR